MNVNRSTNILVFLSKSYIQKYLHILLNSNLQQEAKSENTNETVHLVVV